MSIAKFSAALPMAQKSAPTRHPTAVHSHTNAQTELSGGSSKPVRQLDGVDDAGI
jgi:hypothetical protein